MMGGAGPAEPQRNAPDITPAETARRLDTENLALIDVREPYEWAAGHVPGATHIDMATLGQRLAEVPQDRPVAFICLSGARSSLVATTLRARGYEAYNVAGGFRDWFEAGLPTEPEEATVAPH